MKARVEVDGSIEFEGEPNEIALMLGYANSSKKNENQPSKNSKKRTSNNKTNSIYIEKLGCTLVAYLRKKIPEGLTQSELVEDVYAKFIGVSTKEKIYIVVRESTAPSRIGQELRDKMISNEDKTKNPI